MIRHHVMSGNGLEAAKIYCDNTTGANEYGDQSAAVESMLTTIT